MTDDSISAVLPSLRHLTYLSLAGCSELHMTCLDYLSINCPDLQHLNIASLQRSGGRLVLPDCTTHLDISQDHGQPAVYILPPGLQRLSMRDTDLGRCFLRDLCMYCPNVRYLDAR